MSVFSERSQELPYSYEEWIDIIQGVVGDGAQDSPDSGSLTERWVRVPKVAGAENNLHHRLGRRAVVHIFGDNQQGYGIWARAAFLPSSVARTYYVNPTSNMSEIASGDGVAITVADTKTHFSFHAFWDPDDTSLRSLLAVEVGSYDKADGQDLLDLRGLLANVREAQERRLA